MMVFQTADPFENIQTIAEFLCRDRDSRFPLWMTTQALTMDDFEFQIIMDEEEGRELEDEEYLQQQQVALGVLCFAGAEEAHQCRAEHRQSHRTYLTVRQDPPMAGHKVMQSNEMLGETRN